MHFSLGRAASLWMVKVKLNFQDNLCCILETRPAEKLRESHIMTWRDMELIGRAPLALIIDQNGFQ